MLAIVLVFALATGCDGGESRVNRDKLSLPRIGGKAVRPFGARNAKAIAFVFISTECPISNRYAPEVQRLMEKFGAEGVAFWLVYPNAGESEQVVRQHLKEFRYNAAALRDPKHELVKLSQVRVTPEAAVFRSSGELLYHGRIDDRNADLGKERPRPTTHDLEDALAAVLEGRDPKPAGGRTVGCPIQ
jgi:hypothetical protein